MASAFIDGGVDKQSKTGDELQCRRNELWPLNSDGSSNLHKAIS